MFEGERGNEAATDADRFVALLQEPRAAAPSPVVQPQVGEGALSAPVQQLVDAVRQVLDQAPVELPGPQALADTAALLGAAEQLHAAVLGRVADVDARNLHALDGAPSTGTWVAQQQTSLDRGDVALARRLSGFPVLDAAVREGRLAVAAAERVGKALAKLRRHVDRADGLIDGQPGEQALLGVIGHGVPSLVGQSLAGMADDDPRLVVLLHEAAAIVDLPGGQLRRLEHAFVLLAENLEPHLLPGALGALVDALLPNELEKRAADGHSGRGLGLRLNHDGSGWHVNDGDLDLETGELLNTVLQAELASDPDAPADTAGYERLRADGWQGGDPVPDHGPRSMRQKRHDALKNGLRRLLDSGVLGTRDKVAPHLGATVGIDLLHGAPGALPAVADSGARLPASLVRRWWCDSAVIRFVMGLGRRVIETSHTERTLKAHERRAKKVETGGRCQGAGCRCRPGTPLVPHHPDAYARCGTTSYDDTVMLCRQTHHDVHDGHKTIRLRDGRWLNEHGWTDGPAG